MPKITISEQDLTISNEVNITANTVYVPGMTEKTVDEQPTLYTSVSKFKEHYGEPYKFVSPQLVDGETIIGADDYEKSYIYAVELLSSGVPVMFQNIVSIADYQIKDGKGAITSDAGALQAFYIKLKGREIEGGNQQLSDSIGSISTGTYTNIDGTGTWIDGNQDGHKATYTLKEISNKDDVYNINVLGVVPYSIESIVGLPEGNRFAVRLHCNNASGAIGGSIKINTGGSTGTSNNFGPGAFEASDDSQGAYDLIVIVNVKTSTKIEVKAEWEVTENKGTNDENTYNVSKTYVFHIDTAVLQKNVDDSETVATAEYSIYSLILDKWTYNIKYLTAGGYPTMLEDIYLLQTLTKASAVRGDCIALIDTPYDENIYTSFNEINSLIDISDTATYTLQGTNHCNLNYTLNDNRKDESILKYGTVIGPSGIYTTQELKLYYTTVKQDKNTVILPGSFGYLVSVAYNIDTLKNSNYLAIAGVTRGNIRNLVSLVNETTGAEADAVQVRPSQTGSDEGVGVISLNPIVKVQNYGYCIWGNRTLFPNPEKDLAASSFLNVRVLSADVKKIIYNACQKLTFETNSIELWLKFKTEIEPLLNTMISDGVLEKFEITRLSTTAKATLAVYVKLYTIYAVEDFDITVALTDSTVEQVG